MVQEEFRQAGAVFQEIIEKYSENPRFSPQVDFAKQQLETMREARVL
jgi:4-hydroxyphenylpyruvate dioxygenase-like putative hemolysin